MLQIKYLSSAAEDLTKCSKSEFSRTTFGGLSQALLLPLATEKTVFKEQSTDMSGLESFSYGHMSNVDAPEKHRSSLRGRINLKRTINHLDSDSESFESPSTSSRQESRAESDDESDERPKFYMPMGSGDSQRLNDYDLRGPSSSSYSLGDLPGLAPNDNHKAPKENGAPLSPNFGNSANKDFRPPWAPILRVLNSSDCDMSEAETTISHIVSTGGRPWQFTWAYNPERPYHQS